MADTASIVFKVSTTVGGSNKETEGGYCCLEGAQLFATASKVDDGSTFSSCCRSALCDHGNHSNHTEENNTEAEFSGISVLGITHLVKSSDETDQGDSNGGTLFKV